VRFLLLAVLLAIPAAADDSPVDLGVRRLAMEAHIKLGDALLQKGDTDGAIRAYKDAIRLYERSVAKGKPDAPLAGPASTVLRPEFHRPPLRAKPVRPIEQGLDWLAAHQDTDEDGRWDCDDFAKHDPKGDKCGGKGGALYDVGVTSLATLAFLGAGYTDRGSKRDNPHAKNVRQGLRFLMTSQDDEGVFGGRASRHFIYNHALATLAICESYRMTRNPRYKKPAQEALNFIARARNPWLGWRYGVRSGQNDTSVTALCVMALKSGMYGGLDVDPAAFEGAREWIDKMTDPETGRVGYMMPGGVSARNQGTRERFPPERTHAMTAAGVLTRIFLGEDPRTSEKIKRGAELCTARPPVWNPDDGSIDMYYWYMGTLATVQVSADAWKTWNRAMRTAIEDHQREDGSWDPVGPWGGEGGRVYSTALMTMCLEVSYRYQR